MKKSTLAAKEILKKRKANNSDLKFPSLHHSETTIKPLNISHNYKKKTFQAHDRDVKEDTYRNPYYLPDRVRVTTTSSPPRKEKSVPFIMDEPKTICDLDPTFYTIVEGRPIRSFYDIKSYMRDIRDITLFRANAGYLKEQIIQIESGHTHELEEYEEIHRTFQKVEESFVDFAEDSYKEARAMQDLAEETAVALANVADQLEGYSFVFGKLRNEFCNVFTTYEKLTSYKKFLTHMSPDWWRDRYEEMCYLGTSLCANLFMQLETDTSTEAVKLYKKSTMTLAQLQPQLYFRRPRELATLLDAMGRQCLNYMEIDAYFSASLTKVNAYRKKFKKEMQEKCTDMQDIIEMLEDKVKAMEVKRDYYKEAFDKLLENEFYELVGSFESTKLFTCVQYVHSQLFKDKEDPRDTLTTLMYNIERLYFNICDNLEDLNLEVVKVATRQMFDEDNRIMKQAYSAQNYLKQYDVLCKSLYRSFEPSRRKNRC